MVKWLEQQGMEALHVNRLPDKWHTTDQDICRYADKHDCIVVSKDADFRATCGSSDSDASDLAQTLILRVPAETVTAEKISAKNVILNHHFQQ